MADNPTDTSPLYTGADALLDGLREGGVTHVFANFGSDHPPIIESLARAKAAGRNHPRVVLCPHESVGLAAAHGHLLMSGQAQAVIVHCDVGTQTLGGSVHNAARSRIPAFIFAGETSFTTEGELFGSRNRPVQFIQDVKDQHSIVRPYVKWSYPARTGENLKQLAARGLQFANSSPGGPVYLSAARETLAEALSTDAAASDTSFGWPRLEPQPLASGITAEILTALNGAKRPLIITSHLGRDRDAVSSLAQFCEALAVPVVEASPSCLNLPSDHEHHLGFEPEPLVGDADVVVLIDCDVPWVPVIAEPAPSTKIFHIDPDPLKENLPVWLFQTSRAARADGGEALKGLLEALGSFEVDSQTRSIRRAWIGETRAVQRANWTTEPGQPGPDVITPHRLSQALTNYIDDDTVVLDETITNTLAVHKQVPRRNPGTYFASGGSSLGWHGGAAIGAKLAAPDRDVIALTGDGSYLLSVPSAVHWIARRYQTPFMTVIYNNGGWNATKQNVLNLYPEGAAQASDRYWVNFPEPADLAGVASAAGGAYAAQVEKLSDLEPALASGQQAVHKGQCAVLNVILPEISGQRD